MVQNVPTDELFQGLGFDAIWISPVTKQVSDPARAYNGYTQTDLYDLNSNFGAEKDLVGLADVLHARGMVSWLVIAMLFDQH